MAKHRSLVKVSCPECGEPTMTVELYFYPQTSDSPAERGAILKDLACQCLVTDHDDRFYAHCIEHITLQSGTDEYEGPDTMEEARGER